MLTRMIRTLTATVITTAVLIGVATAGAGADPKAAAARTPTCTVTADLTATYTPRSSSRAETATLALLTNCQHATGLRHTATIKLFRNGWPAHDDRVPVMTGRRYYSHLSVLAGESVQAQIWITVPANGNYKAWTTYITRTIRVRSR